MILHLVSRRFMVPVAIILLAVPGWAQDLKKGVTDLSQVDADFHVQGEYSGTAVLDGYSRSVGLQVVALGDGKFEALAYRGGLPGNGYDCSVKLKLAGSRATDGVILGGENLVVILQSGNAVVKNLAGQCLGVLQATKRVSPTAGAMPPSNAIVLFDGRSTDRLNNAKVTTDGLLEVGCETKDSYQNFTLHAEFRTPYMPYAREQARGNSGFYLQKRYEVQVLDSFGLEPQNNDCGSLYKFKAPAVNMSFPPLSWQTYDITFQAPKFNAEGQRVAKGRITVRQNGVVIHNNLELDNKTGGGSVEGPNALPILLQNHGNPINFRNIWLIDHGSAAPLESVPLQPAYPSLLASSCQQVAPNCCGTSYLIHTRQRHLFRR